MADPTRSAFARQHQQLRSFAAPELLLQEILSTDQVEQAIAAEGIRFRDRLFTPLVTFWTFLIQVFTADASCQTALSRLIAWLAGQDCSLPSSNTGGYCKARQRLPESLLTRLSKEVARQAAATGDWLWHGHRVRLVDGTSVSMPDTEKNQQAYPQQRNQKPGLGFPLARLVAVFDLACGCVTALALGAWRGKGTGEASLFRPLIEECAGGDVVVGDSYFSSFFLMTTLLRRGADYVGRLNNRRPVDYRRGRRLGPYDTVVVWRKPPPADLLEPDAWADYADTLTVRLVRIHVRIRGFRVNVLDVVTTLLDDSTYSKTDLVELYRRRWQAELHLRSIKSVMKMDVLTCKTPEMVRKEIAMHLLVYNLIRALMARAALRTGCRPEDLSFKASWKGWEAFAPRLRSARGEKRDRLVESLLDHIASCRVNDRPDRYEPRVKKRRPKPTPRMTKPRQAYKKQRKARAAA
jgi:Transposase DDE domain